MQAPEAHIAAVDGAGVVVFTYEVAVGAITRRDATVGRASVAIIAGITKNASEGGHAEVFGTHVVIDAHHLFVDAAKL